MKISEAFDEYRSKFMLPSNRSPWTIQHHELCKRSPVLYAGNVNIKKLSEEIVVRWHMELQKTRGVNTVRCYLQQLKNVLKWCNSHGIPCLNCELVLIPRRVDSTPSWLTAGEVAKMIECAPNLRSKLVISLLYSSGIRLSELISLNRGQIHDGEFVAMGKGNKIRPCYIDDRTEKLLKAYLGTRCDTCPALIVSYLHQSRMTPTNIQYLVKNAARRAGIHKHVTPHVLRHSYATNLMRNGADIRSVQELLGHSNLQTTQIYTHVTDRRKQNEWRKYHSF